VRSQGSATHPHVVLLYWSPWFDLVNPFEFPAISCANNISVTVTHNRSQIREAAALIFHVRGFNPQDLPPRSTDQKWILDTQEAPVHDAAFMEDFATMRQFDYSMSYHTGADFFHPLWLYDNYTQLVLQRSPVPFEQKAGLVFFLASNCNSYSDREAYIEELMKYVEVHSYGSCLHNMGGKTIEEDRTIREMSKYKFYLAFENANCDDYVSEKLANAFRAGVVPVVAGPADYSSFIPNNSSVINARDFPSAKELALYLHRVGSSKMLYDKYLRYKTGHGFTETFEDMWKRRGELAVFCEMGEELLASRNPSQHQAGTAVLPSLNQCEEEGFMRKLANM